MARIQGTEIASSSSWTSSWDFGALNTDETLVVSVAEVD
jgi:hypothetical protein